MPNTWFVDFDGGNDSNNGTTFAQRWKNMAKATTGNGVAAGDTVRVMGHPSAAISVNATWTGLVGGALTSKTISSSTNATPIVITSTAHGFQNGDWVNVIYHATNTNANGLWKVANKTDNTFELAGSTGNAAGTSGWAYKFSHSVIELASPLSKTIACTGSPGTASNPRTVWTPSTNVATSLVHDPSGPEGYGYDHINPNSSFTTGLAAYWNTGTIDLSAYQGVIFWFKSPTNYTAGDAKLTLCTSTNGVTAVHDIPIPAGQSTSRWNPIYWDNGSALNSSIQSIALHVLVDRGAVSYYISNIIAVKAPGADCIKFTNLIGKADGEQWFRIMSVDDSAISLAGDPNSGRMQASTGCGYYGTSETVATHMIQPFISPQTVSVSVSGSAGSLVYFEGGWDRTAMTTQNCWTWFTNAGPNYGFSANADNYISFNRFGFAGGMTLTFTGSSGGVFHTYDNFGVFGGCSCQINNDATIGTIIGYAGGQVQLPNNRATATLLKSFNGGTIVAGANHKITAIETYGASSGATISGRSNYVQTVTTVASQLWGLILGASGVNSTVVIDSVTVNGGSAGVYMQYPSIVTINGGSTSGGLNGGLGVCTTGVLNLRKFTVNESTEVYAALGGGSINSHDHDNTVGNHQLFRDGALISSTTSVRHTASGIAWAFQPTDATKVQAASPLILSLAKIACAASALVTVKAWLRRTNTGLTLRLMCKGKQIGGVASDVYTAMTAAADTWEEVTITFTPNEAGVVEITAEAWGGTTYVGYVDDMTITQA